MNSVTLNKQTGYSASNGEHRPAKKSSNMAGIVRTVILAAILGGIMLLNYLHIHGGSKYPSVHAICPVGGLENLWAWLAGRANLQKLFSGTMTLSFFSLIFALMFGRAFCGNICPFGALQEFAGKIGKKKLAVPEKADKIMRYAKYLVLALVTVMAWITATIWFSPYDPYTAFAHIWSGGEIFSENGTGFTILIVVILASIFIDRFFCKYLCPAGAMYGVISKASPTKIKRNDCSSCGRCSKVCPMNVNLREPGSVSSAECIACGRCATVCPSHKADVNITLFGKTVKPVIFVLVTVTVFFSSILVFDAAGLYQVTVPALETVQQNGNYLKFDDLRGSMSIEAGAMYTGMELKDFYVIMEIPETVPKDTLMKNISTYVPGYDFHVIKASR